MCLRDNIQKQSGAHAFDSLRNQILQRIQALQLHPCPKMCAEDTFFVGVAHFLLPCTPSRGESMA
jgi:hypothetical protein